MQESLTSQILIFVYSLALGMFLGFAYDIFRIIRMVINSRNIAIFIQDVLYFILSGGVTFLFVLSVNGGNSRFYILAGEGIGWIAYHITLGEVIYKYSNKTVNFVKSKIAALKNKLLKKFSKSNDDTK